MFQLSFRELASTVANRTVPEDSPGYTKEKWLIARDAVLSLGDEIPKIVEAVISEKLTVLYETNLEAIPDLAFRIPDHIEGSDEFTCPDNLRWMLQQIEERGQTFPPDKTVRWIGFVQGVLALSKHLNVTWERNRTRSIYHSGYKRAGLPIPETRSRTQDT